MSKTKRARHTFEFRLEAVRLLKADQSVAAVAATLDMSAQPAQSISNWVKVKQEGELSGAGTKPFIERNRRHWPISVLCEGLDVSRARFRSAHGTNSNSCFKF